MPPERVGCESVPAMRDVSPQEGLIESVIREDEMEDAFYLVKLDWLRSQYARWTKHLPRVSPHYAVKCNPNRHFLKIFASIPGMGFDCASRGEIEAVCEAMKEAHEYALPERIIYANPVKQASHLRIAKTRGVELMTFDSADELRKIKRVYPDAKLVLRIHVNDSQSICCLGLKFGVSKEDVPVLLGLAAELNLNVIGVSFHVGSNCKSVESYTTAVRDAFDASELFPKYGLTFELLDIGGGFPGYESPVFPSFETICDSVRPLVDELFPDPSVRVIAEPGRFFAAGASVLVCRVIGKKKGDSQRLYLNDGTYQSFNCLFNDHAEVKAIPLTSYNIRVNSQCDSAKSRRDDDPAEVETVLFGPTCDSIDTIDRKAMLPAMYVDDWLYFEHMGAYTGAAGSCFNGFERTQEVYV